MTAGEGKQDSFCPGGKPPVPIAEQGHQRQQQAPDDDGVEQDANGEARGEHLDLGTWRRRKGHEREDEDEGRTGDEPPLRARPGTMVCSVEPVSS